MFQDWFRYVFDVKRQENQNIDYLGYEKSP